MAAIFCLPPPLIAWSFTRKAPDPANERSGAGKPAPGAEGEDGTPVARSLGAKGVKTAPGGDF